MTPDPQDRLADMINRLSLLRQEIEPRAESLRAEGYPVDDLLAELEEFLAAMQGNRDGPFDAKGFIARLNEIVEEVTATRHVHDQAGAIGAVVALPGVLDEMVQQSGELRKHGGDTEAQTAADLEAGVAAARARMERGEVPMDELEDLSLTLTAQQAELQRRIRKRTAALMIYWEKQTPEWWAQHTSEELAQMHGLQAQWAEQREVLLSELPIADRKELEAMTLEDFTKAR